MYETTRSFFQYKLRLSGSKVVCVGKLRNKCFHNSEHSPRTGRGILRQVIWPIRICSVSLSDLRPVRHTPTTPQDPPYRQPVPLAETKQHLCSTSRTAPGLLRKQGACWYGLDSPNKICILVTEGVLVYPRIVCTTRSIHALGCVGLYVLSMYYAPTHLTRLA